MNDLVRPEYGPVSSCRWYPNPASTFGDVLFDLYRSGEELFAVEFFGPETPRDVADVADVQMERIIASCAGVYREPVLPLVAVLTSLPEYSLKYPRSVRESLTGRSI